MKRDSYDYPVVLAAADLAHRVGGEDFRVGYRHEDIPMERAAWFASCKLAGDTLAVEDMPSPEAAAYAFAVKLLRAGQCRCGRPVTLSQLNSTSKNGRSSNTCWWRLKGTKWVSACPNSTLLRPARPRRGKLKGWPSGPAGN